MARTGKLAMATCTLLKAGRSWALSWNPSNLHLWALQELEEVKAELDLSHLQLVVPLQFAVAADREEANTKRRTVGSKKATVP